MSAKHKRPFVVFAAVALICGMVLFTGVRSKADIGLAPEPPSAARGTTSGHLLSRLPDPQGPVTLDPSPSSDPDSEGGSSEETDSFGPSEFETTPTDDGSGNGDDSNGAPDSFDGGILDPSILPDPDDVDPGEDDALPQDDEGKRDGKGRGGRGKKDKDDEKDNDGDEGSDEEEPADVDGLPDSADEGDPSGDQVDVDADETP